jgi:hypothetical protein
MSRECPDDGVESVLRAYRSVVRPRWFDRGGRSVKLLMPLLARVLANVWRWSWKRKRRLMPASALAVVK